MAQQWLGLARCRARGGRGSPRFDHYNEQSSFQRPTYHQTQRRKPLRARKLLVNFEISEQTHEALDAQIEATAGKAVEGLLHFQAGASRIEGDGALATAEQIDANLGKADKLAQSMSAPCQKQTLSVCWRSTNLAATLNITPETSGRVQRRLAEEQYARATSELVARQAVQRVQLTLAAGAIIGTWVWDPNTDRDSRSTTGLLATSASMATSADRASRLPT